MLRPSTLTRGPPAKLTEQWHNVRDVCRGRGEIVDTTRDSRPENDKEKMQRIVGAQSERAQKLIEQHRAAHASLTEQLLKSETVDGSVVRQVVEQSAVATAAS
jgi:ATP-dependent Zn protease